MFIGTHMEKREIKAVNVNTGEEILFKTLTEAGKYENVSKSTMTWRISTGYVTKSGWRFFRADNPDFVYKKKKQTYVRKKELRFKFGLTDEDREKYRIIKYEKNVANVCITPCPFYDSPKPMIGTARCQNCGSFHGIDRKTNEVACSRNIAWLQRKQSIN